MGSIYVSATGENWKKKTVEVELNRVEKIRGSKNCLVNVPRIILGAAGGTIRYNCFHAIHCANFSLINS